MGRPVVDKSGFLGGLDFYGMLSSRYKGKEDLSDGEGKRDYSG